MKCNIVFHPATTTMSRCWNFCKTSVDWTSPAKPKGHTEKSGVELTNGVTLEKSDINTINWPCVDHEKSHPILLYPMMFDQTPIGQHNSDGRCKRRPCRTYCAGTCFYYYRSWGSHAPEHNACFTGRAFDWWGGETAEWLQWHLIYWLLTTL